MTKISSSRIFDNKQQLSSFGPKSSIIKGKSNFSFFFKISSLTDFSLLLTRKKNEKNIFDHFGPKKGQKKLIFTSYIIHPFFSTYAHSVPKRALFIAAKITYTRTCAYKKWLLNIYGLLNKFCTRKSSRRNSYNRSFYYFSYFLGVKKGR